MRNDYDEKELAILRRFGRHLRKLRKERGLSQDALAGLANLNRNYLGEVERGERNIALLNLHRLAFGLNVSVPSLLDSQQDPTPKRGPRMQM